VDRIRYKDGYKYVLNDDYAVQLEIKPEIFIYSDFIRFDTDGILYIKKGYAWDGPSGPAIDTKNFMRGSLVHDALYQLLREGRLAAQRREAADHELWKICLQDGMTWLRAWWVYQGVRLGGGPAASVESHVLEAP